MRYIKVALYILSGIAFLLLVLTYTLPDNYKVEKEYSFNCNRDFLFNTIGNYKTWASWSSWNFYGDSTLYSTVPGNESGKNAAMIVVGKAFGSVTIKTAEFIAPKYLKQEFIFDNGKHILYSYMKFTEEAGLAKLNWVMEGRVERDAFQKIFALFAGSRLQRKMEFSKTHLNEYCIANFRILE